MPNVEGQLPINIHGPIEKDTGPHPINTREARATVTAIDALEILDEYC